MENSIKHLGSVNRPIPQKLKDALAVKADRQKKFQSGELKFIPKNDN